MNEEYKEMLERFEQICQNAKKELCAKKEKGQEKRFIEKIDKELTISEYDEIEYWLANVEVLDNTDYILNNRKAKILIRYLKEKDKEIERLNNIINDIDRYIHNWRLEDIGEKTMLILNDILLIKNGMSDEVIRLKGVDKE